MIKPDKFDAVILANGEFPSHQYPISILRNAEYVVCCDGGADTYIAKGFIPNIIIGDGDSLSTENRVKFADIICVDSDQETNDQTKAVNYLIKRGCKSIAIVGATGKREDHTLGNIALLIDYMRMGVEVKCFTDYGVFIPCNGDNSFLSYKGERVSIFNFNATHFESIGLKYPIYDFTSLWQGTLNCCEGDTFEIKACGDYLVFISYK